MSGVVRMGALAAFALAAFGVTGALSTALLNVQTAQRSAHTVEGSIEPALDLVDAPFGGRVSEVLVKEGDRVRSGDVLVRLENAQLQHRLEEVSSARESLVSALREQAELQELPPKVKQYLYANYPAAVQADLAYNRALSAVQSSEAGDRPAAYERLSQAAQRRVEARRHLQHLFSSLTYPTEMHELLRQLEDGEMEAHRLLDRNEPKATSPGAVELLDLHPGDTLIPGAPVAMIRSADVYTSSLTLSKSEAQHLNTAVQLTGALQNGRSLAGRIESVVVRPVRAAFRHKSGDAEESVVSIRVQSAEAIEPGARIRFELP